MDFEDNFFSIMRSVITLNFASPGVKNTTETIKHLPHSICDKKKIQQKLHYLNNFQSLQLFLLLSDFKAPIQCLHTLRRCSWFRRTLLPEVHPFQKCDQSVASRTLEHFNTVLETRNYYIFILNTKFV